MRKEVVGRGGAVLLGALGQQRLAKQLRLLADDRERIVAAAQVVPMPGRFEQRCGLVTAPIQLAECAGEQRVDAIPVGQPVAPRVAVGPVQRVRVHRWCVEVGRPDVPGQGLREMTLQQARILVGGVPLGLEVPRELRGNRIGGDVSPPEVVHGFHHEIVVARHELGAHGQPGREGIVGERPLAETVDGEDGGLVEGGERELQARRERLQGGAGARQQVAGQPADERIGRARGRPVQECEQFDHAAADALAQFRRGGIGEGHHQNLLHRELAPEQQAQVQAADGPGLAGAGRGLDEIHARERAVEDVERLGTLDSGVHSGGSSRCAKAALNTVSAQASKSASSASTTPRSARR